MPLPPGPKGRLLQTMKLLRSPFTYYPPVFKKYGDPFTIPAINGTVVCTARPELIKKIFAADPNTYLPFAVDSFLTLVGPRSVFVLTGAEHRRERKLLMPPFHGDRMRAYGRAMMAVAEQKANAWTAGKPFAMMDSTQEMTLDIIIRTVFGVQDETTLVALRDAIRVMAESVHPMVMFTKFMRNEFGGFGPYSRMIRSRKALDAIVVGEIQRRRKTEDFGQDILSLLLMSRYDDGSEMDDATICDELRGLLFAGHETTAIALAWAFYWTHKHPEVLARLHEEIDALPVDADPEVIAKLPYLDAVCSETMRLNPIIQENIRTLAVPFELGGYTIEPGVCVASVSAMLHYDPELYPEPHAFRPERFLERSFGPHEYIPFGGGHRRCIGAAFASFEMRLILATVLRSRKLRLETDADLIAVRRNVTMAPQKGVPMVYVGERGAPFQPAEAAMAAV